MDLLKDGINRLFLKYLAAAFGSTLIISIYSLVDTIVIGQYEGPNGTAAVANFMPMWSIMFAIGLLLGIGGSVCMAQRRGAGDMEEGNLYFTTALLLTAAFSVVIFIAYNVFSSGLLYLFGGRGEVQMLAGRYSFWISLASPLFIFGQVLIPFVRNDGHPGLTTAAVMTGGIFNIFGDLFFVFGLNMGISGAGLATAIGQALCVLVLLRYLFSSKCRLRMQRPFFQNGLVRRTRTIFGIGGATFIIDISIGVLAVLINNQVMLWSGAAALSVYGMISSLSTTFQTFGYAVGESAQAIMSVNYGAGNRDRVLKTRRIASITALVLGFFCWLAGMLFPEQLIRLYMTPTQEVLTVGITAVRIYFTAFLLLLFNVSSTYYFQSVERPRDSMIISMARGIVLSAVFVLLLPFVFGVNGIWAAIPVTELLVAGYIIYKYRKDS